MGESAVGQLLLTEMTKIAEEFILYLDRGGGREGGGGVFALEIF